MQTQVFTFGDGHECPCGIPLRNSYTVIEGDYDTARATMARVWGRKWAFQYENEERAGVFEWNMYKVTTNESDPSLCPCCRTGIGKPWVEPSEEVVHAGSILWFGEPWGAPVCAPAAHVPRPTGHQCVACAETIYANDSGVYLAHLEDGQYTRRPWHKACFFKNLGISEKIDE